ncbi:MAG: TlpA family protein disulfide reductase [Candidatus Hodarchaeota archaeon]
MRKKIIVSFVFILSIFALENGQAAPLAQINAPNFSLRNIRTNSQTTLSSFQGKVVLIDFFATWCQPCEVTIPVLKGVDASFGGEFQLISIDVQWYGGENDQTVLNFIGDQGMNWLVLMDSEDNPAAVDYGVSAIPTFFLIDKNGNIRKTHQGATITPSGLKSEISNLLEEGSTPPANNGNDASPSRDLEDTTSAEENDDNEGIPTGILFGGLIFVILSAGSLGLFLVRRPSEASSPKDLGTYMETQFTKERTALAEIRDKLEKSSKRKQPTDSIRIKRKARRRR